MMPLIRTTILFILVAALVGMPFSVMAEQTTMGIVIMHGKGGSPKKWVSDLADALASKGYLVANLEMPWSGKREYDVPVGNAEAEIESALADLRNKGAKKVFVAGHSQGGAFALHFSGKHTADGIIAIAPGGNVDSNTFREKLGASVARARQLIADGKGDEKTQFEDYEGSKGTYPVFTTPASYITWFDPDGAMNTVRAARAVNPKIPLLWLVAKNDYPGLRKSNIPMFASFPANRLNTFYEPDSDHLRAPAASLEEIVRWTTMVTTGQK